MTALINTVSVKLVRKPVAAFGERRQINCPADIAALARQFIGDADREHAVVIHVDARHCINAIHLLSIGDTISATIHPREVFKAAILANATAVILAHNHPSGDPTPSANDVAVTRRVAEAGRVLGIELLDHVVVGVDNWNHTSYVSLRNAGYLPG